MTLGLARLLEAIVLRFGMQGEYILEHTNAKCHFIHFSQCVDHSVT